MAIKELPVLMGSERVLALPSRETIITGSEEWLTWLDGGQSFRYEGEAGNVTVRPGKGGWYAYKKAHGKLYNAFVAPKYEVTVEKLEAVTGNLIRKGEENKPAVTVKQTEMEELRSQVSRLEEQLKVVTEQLEMLNDRLGELAA